MNSSNILVDIKALYNTFTKKEKKVADYVLKNKGNVAYLVINELSTECEVGDTTISRFCKKLKLSGYQEFRIKLLIATQQDEVIKGTKIGNILSTDSLDEVINKVYSNVSSTLNETKGLLDKKIIDDVVTEFIKAKRIFFYGVGSSALASLEMCSKFMRITSKVNFVQDLHMQTMQASILDKDDLAVIHSYSGETKDIIDIARIIKKQGAKTVAISRYKQSELSKYIDFMVNHSANEDPMQGNSLTARISQIFILNILYTEYHKRTIEESGINKKNTAQAIVNKLY